MKKNIAEILKYCDEGLPLWSPAYGNVELELATNTEIIIRTRIYCVQLNVDGTLSADGECMLFPSPEQRDWEEFRKAKEKVEKFDINTLKPFDRVLVRDDSTMKWAIDLWMVYAPNNEQWKCLCLGSHYAQCIPYEGNEHLLLTADMPDEYYITWEEKKMKKAMNKAARCYEQTMGCTIQETVLGIGIMAVGLVCIWMAAVLQGGAA